MFAVEERDRVRRALLALAEADPAVTGTAVTGALDEAEPRRALGAALTTLAAELDRTDPHLAARLQPTLAELRERR